MNEQEPTISDQILDLLLDALQERQQARASAPPSPPAGTDLPRLEEPAVEQKPEAVEPELLPVEAEALEEPAAAELAGPPVEQEAALPEPLAPVHLDRMLGRLFVVLIALVIIINIPFNKYGTNLARAMPDSAALIIRDGLVLKGSGEKIYVLQDNKLRWISSLDAFEQYGYHWDQVHLVEDAFLDSFEEGQPVHLLLKCNGSPHIYAQESGAKRWIKDIPTFELQGYVWDDVRFVSCDYLRRLPDGRPIPPDAGAPPQP